MDNLIQWFKDMGDPSQTQLDDIHHMLEVFGHSCYLEGYKDGEMHYDESTSFRYAKKSDMDGWE